MVQAKAAPAPPGRSPYSFCIRVRFANRAFQHVNQVEQRRYTLDILPIHFFHSHSLSVQEAQELTDEVLTYFVWRTDSAEPIGNVLPAYVMKTIPRQRRVSRTRACKQDKVCCLYILAL